MCGRYTLAVDDPDLLADRFDFPHQDLDRYRLRYNVAPTQEVPAVVFEDGNRRLALLRWGLVPSWAKDKSGAARLINARGESVAEKPSFRTAFKRRRCLVLADGFYEWKREGKVRQPFRFLLDSGEPFAFAGLHEVWKPGTSDELHTVTIITTAANDLVSPIHDRMPVILPRDVEAEWLDPETDASDLTDLLLPYPGEAMHSYPVSTLVNSPANDSPDCIAPAGELL